MTEHKLKTIADILQVVTPENIENFKIDFGNWLDMRVRLSQVKTQVIEVQVADEFHWIDDGKNEAHINIQVIEGKEGV